MAPELLTTLGLAAHALLQSRRFVVLEWTITRPLPVLVELVDGYRKEAHARGEEFFVECCDHWLRVAKGEADLFPRRSR